MNEKIDEVAKAIRDECQEQGYLVSISEIDRLWVNLARAAIAAMHEPTARMIAVSAGATQTVWRAMIDEMLK